MSFRVRVVVAILLCVCARPAAALDPSRSLTQSIHRIWQVQQGLPQAWIYSVAQTSDGYLWLGTQTGLVKFDGVRFTVATDQELEGVSNRDLWVTHLLADDHGGLWVGTAQAGLMYLNAAKTTRYSAAQGLPAGSIDCLFDDRAGHIFACTPNGLAELADGKIRVYGIEDGLPTLDVRAACVTRDGQLIAGASGDPQLATWNGSRFTTHPLPVSKTAAVQSMVCDAAGVVWAGTSDGLVKIADGREQRLTTADGLPDNSILTLTESRDAGILAGTTNGFARIRGTDIDDFQPEDGLSQSTVYGLFEDREGSLWAATKHGLNQFMDARAIPYTTSEGLPGNNTGPVLQDHRGIIWVGTLGEGLARFDGRAFKTITTKNGLASDTIRALAEDSDGDLWVGTDGGLTRLHDGRVVASWSARTGLPDNQVRALYTDQAGAMWIATPKGPAVFRNGRIAPARDTRDTTSADILAFGSRPGDGVFAVPDETPAFAHADALYRDRDGLLWVGTLGQGLRLIDGEHTVTFSVLDGLFDDVIYGIAEDDHGRLWMACSKGIFSVSRDDLKQFASGESARITSTPYSPLDALRTVECQPGVQPAVSRTSDGKLWFSTIRGVLVIDPEHFERKVLPPEVIVEDVTVNGQRSGPGELGALAAGSTNVDFNYTAASFVAPRNLTFRYRLDGVDSSWIEAGSRREAFYSNLAPGSFRFHVAACTPDGACNENTTPVAFTITPFFYQRVWFLPLCVGFVALAGVGVYQLRIRQVKTKFDLVLAERGRIARELHDTLIQGFSGITIAMQAMMGRLPADSRERKALGEIVADAGSAMREARRSLMGLRSHDSSSAGLAAAVEQTTRQLAEPNGIKLKLSLDECDVPTEVEYNLVRIAQEAVTNAIKHSGARNLRVTLNRTPTQLLLSVKDDGAGFDASVSSPEGHFGLIGMKERAAQIGARFQISSEPGHGTTVSVLMES